MSTNQNPQPSEQKVSYVAWSTEKKKSVMMYLWLGIVLSLSRDSMSVFEYFHLRQSLGWWMVFMIVILVSIILMFLPLIWLLWWLVIVAMLVIGWLFAKQARDGVYFARIDAALLPLFVGVGWWVLQMFEISIHILWEDDVAADSLTPPQTQ
jgi:hypothetical protein